MMVQGWTKDARPPEWLMAIAEACPTILVLLKQGTESSLDGLLYVVFVG